jgi:hypothetical protein
MRVYLVIDCYDRQTIAVCKTEKIANKMANKWPERYYVQESKVVSKVPEWFKEIQNDRY